MLNILGPAFHLGLSKTDVTLLRTHGWRRQYINLVGQGNVDGNITAEPKPLATSLAQLLGQSTFKRISCSVVIADELVRYFMVTPPRNTTRLQDCQAAASMRFQALYGEPTTHWQLAADWDASQPFLACAIPNPLLEAIRHCGIQYKMTFTGIVPHFIAAWNHWSSHQTAGTWFGVVHSRTLTLAAFEGRRLLSIQTTSLSSDAVHDSSWLTTHIAREALRLNTIVPAKAQLCGEVPVCWTGFRTDSFSCMRLDISHPLADGVALPSSANLAICGVHR